MHTDTSRDSALLKRSLKLEAASKKETTKVSTNTSACVQPTSVTPLTPPSHPPETRVSPPCRSSITGCSCCCTRLHISPSRPQTPIDPSAAPVTNRVAVLLCTVCIAVTAPPWPMHTPRHVPDCASHRRAVQSSLPVSSRGRRPSPAAAEAAAGRKLICLTGPVWPWHSESGTPGCGHVHRA